MTRMRSPNYPSLSLMQSLDMVAKIHRANRTNIITREDAAQAMGYSGLTGRSMTVLAALIHFGLLAKAGKGDVRVTQVAVDALHGIDDSERNTALLKAAFTPQLFQDIYERFPDGIPSEAAIRSYLIKQEFSDAAVGPAVTAFLATYREVENIRESEGYGSDPAATQESPVQPQEVPLNPVPVPHFATLPATLSGTKDGPLDFNLSSAGLSVSGMTNSASELKAYIARLQLFVGLLPDQEVTD